MLNDLEIVGFKAIVNTAPQNVLIRSSFYSFEWKSLKKNQKKIKAPTSF